MAQKFQDLLVWQRSVELAVSVYAVTRGFPAAERYGLISQLRRSAVSISSNIAEGRGRLTDGDFRQFLGVAQGSLCELQTQLIIARKLDFVTTEDLIGCERLCEEVAKMLSALIGRIPRRAKS